MAPFDIISEYYRKGSRLADILLGHSKRVRDKALTVIEKVPHLKADAEFIAEAAMLHDIGIYQTAAPDVGCHGPYPYICHGVIGRRILEQHGLHAHALVCERHVGVGITMADIEAGHLPLPKRDMLPISIEEIIVCYADKFFSKTNGGEAHSLENVFAELARYGNDKVERFMSWHELLSGSC